MMEALRRFSRLIRQSYSGPVLITILSLSITACSTAGMNRGISAVTPLPEVLPTATLTTTPVPVAQAKATTALAPATATPTPLSVDLPQGDAVAIAAATDTAFQPTPRSRLVFDDGPVLLTFDEFYSGVSIRGGLELSDKLVSLDGQIVTIEGYMAPPLKPMLDYFVLTRIRLAFCPFCSTAADWPDDIALVYVVGDSVEVTSDPVRLTGRLEVGVSVDPETGMVSLVRIYADTVEVLT